MKTKLTTTISEAARAILAGNLVAFPTETVYGLGANAFDERAVKKIFAAKGRPADNPLIVHIWNKKQIGEIASEVSPVAKKLVDKCFPGQLTVVVKKNARIPSIVTAGLSTVCIRMPSLSITRAFLKQCGVPVAAPSANLSGKPSPTTWQHVLHDMNERIPLILKGPKCRHGLESTVIDCTKKVPVLLRPGAVTVEELEKIVGQINIPIDVKETLSPGMKYRHYSPNGKVHLVKRGAILPANCAFIGFSNPNATYKIKVKTVGEYAKKLYWFFRECDLRGIENIYAEIPEKKGIGRALLNRLEKASTQ